MDNYIKRIKYCEICKEEASTICFNCINYFCNSCSNFIHSKKINKAHIRDKIDIYKLFDIKCKIHPNKSLEFFCIDENSNYIYINFFSFRIVLSNMLLFKLP